MLSPNIFMPLTEKTGLIIELDLWVMQQAMKDISQWYAQGLIPGTLALNMSMKQLEHPNLAEIIQENFENFHFKPEWLELEITETEMMKKPDEVISILEDLSAMGMNIAIDDFGTGYSSLSHLKRLPINKLKIDKSFVQDVPVDEDASIIVKTIISLAKSLKIDILAEGVETKAQKDFLIAQECYKVQGYYYSQPLTSTQIHKLFVAQKKLSEALES
jgi:EAL domain-containing protein (putative c-di-GMP-specific phosphodiesterase class I)